LSLPQALHLQALKSCIVRCNLHKTEGSLLVGAETVCSSVSKAVGENQLKKQNPKKKRIKKRMYKKRKYAD
jgi:hypothetical protein